MVVTCPLPKLRLIDLSEEDERLGDSVDSHDGVTVVVPVQDELLIVQTCHFQQPKHPKQRDAGRVLHYYVVVVLALEHIEELEHLNEDS